MLNIQLFLEGQEVELNKKVSFPLNKSFENLWNPTDIIVEYSKSINIPATKSNNKLMANAYRIDRQFVINEDNPNIGMFLDPLKRIPMKLVYNNSILLDGYAKYTSVTVNSKETYYTFNLYGALGDVFQTLMDCVVDENKLTDEQRAESDGGRKYVIDCPWERYLIDKEFVKNSWDNDNPNLQLANEPYDYIGFAPAYRGLYENFESTSALGLTWNGAFLGKPTETTSIENDLKSQWKINLSNITNEDGSRKYSDDYIDDRVESIDFNMILPIGINEHIMRQFRSYEQKPYIYINALFEIFRSKCRFLTDYDIRLDSSWFNMHNPYWTRLCYMLDYLSVKGNTLQSSLPFTGYVKKTWQSRNKCTATYNITDTEVLSKEKINLEPFTLCTEIKYAYEQTTKPVSIKFAQNAEYLVDVIVTSNGTTTTHKFWGATRDPSTVGDDEAKNDPGSGYTDAPFVLLNSETRYDNDEGKIVGKTYFTVPAIEIEHTPNTDLSITYQVVLKDNRPTSWLGPFGWIVYVDGKQVEYDLLIVAGDDDYTMIFPNTVYKSNWRTNTTCELKNLYAKDEPLFNVILQYTKMFGLIWKTDYNKKTINIMTRETYFKDYDVVDWSDKVDKSKGMIIEPVSFSSKYVTFNYDDVEGYRYSGYRNKYGVDYGEKKLKTKYNFDTKEEKLFKEKIGPSSVSCKSFYDIDTLRDWDTVSKLQSTPSEVNFIDCENEDESSAISLNNWYFRVDNFTPTKEYYITDASSAELSDDRYYWLGNEMLKWYDCYLTAQVIPRFSPVFPVSDGGSTLGCIFNCPNEDYTNDKKISEAKGNYIYDMCWSDYINERYNANNKKLTCYVKISPIEFEQFNFKTFVTIDNQLFVVNKIVDYDVNSDTTKCEFIQVSDTNGYTSQKVDFPPYKLLQQELYISPHNQYGNLYYGSTSLDIEGYPYVNYEDDFDVKIVPVSTNGYSSCFTEGYEQDTSDTGKPILAIDIIYESSVISSEKYEAHVTFGGVEHIVPIYILEN